MSTDATAKGRHPSGPRTLHTALVAGVAALGGFLFGFDTAVINGAVGAIETTFGPGSLLLGFSVASALLGCAAGAWFAGPLANRYGRIRVMLMASLLFSVSAIGSAAALDIWSLTAWRVVGGLAVGAASVIAPAYIAEIAPAGIRGRLGSLQQLAIVIGIFVALLSNYLIATGAGGATEPLWLGADAWRWMFLAELVPAVAYGVLASRIPESPRYLVLKERLTEARAVLDRFVGGDTEERLDEIRETLRSVRTPRLADLLGPRLGLLPIVWAGIGLSLFQQLVGINVIFYYSTVLWQSVGFSESDSFLITMITSITNIAVTFIAIATVDKVGRKPLLLSGSVGMFAALTVMALLFGNAPIVDDEPQLGPVAGPAALIAANVFVVCFGASWGPVVWILLGEMFSNRIRAAAIAVAAAAQWLANFAVSTTFPVLSDVGLGLAYGIYATCAGLSIVFVAKAISETKGKELEEMPESSTTEAAR
ncbi:sugar porter family MFS transporter [Haloechinothrix sp. YIM 98757]|uniref:Sugar porter family MFS transporter n=1 Tax=Haloechinothrix aidingensis TaxID=2752311 RepID=A0A838A5T0_9PSEU|nr:sugar porter family MFS transporter [Haloechinothrix aidingensis]MBA0124388.1 sugar porter family MFS transporter [Haloechinothrix aidingensis]